jgi:ABC-2 type transport system ATP-binding protein
MAIIEIKNLKKIYRRSHLGRVTRTIGVDGLDLSVEQGEIFGLLGLNGSGKTTTIKIILGLLFPTEGSITVDGILMPSLDARKRIGFLPEMPYFYKILAARELLRFYGRLSEIPEGERAAKIQTALSRVKMEKFANRRLSEFSKGMLQRIGIAQAIMHEPPILIFDEPVTGIDPIGLMDMRQLIGDLNESGKTIFFSSHSISEVEKICHRVGILVKGKLARVIRHDEWAGKEGRLEQIFVETVQPSLTATGGVS